MGRKSASIRFDTSTGAFEVKLEDLPMVFTVTYAAGRHGPLESIDLHLGAQVNLLGRSMRLMQADAPTTAWLEEEARILLGIKVSLVSCLERHGEHVRCLR
ncbi:unnamed protein product [Choristocarpus tenellus]